MTQGVLCDAITARRPARTIMNIWALHGPRTVNHLRYRAHIPQSICTVLATQKHVWQFSARFGISTNVNFQPADLIQVLNESSDAEFSCKN